MSRGRLEIVSCVSRTTVLRLGKFPLSVVRDALLCLLCRLHEGCEKIADCDWKCFRTSLDSRRDHPQFTNVLDQKV
jgi:hypothetical protein